MDICIDFDGTCVTHEFPKIGKDVGAVPVLKELVSNGHRLILFTMRSDEHPQEMKSYDKEIIAQMGMYLSDAELWFKENGIELYGVQSNPTQKEWTTSPKAYGQLYIDDAAFGCPLLINKNISGLPFVNWEEVRRGLVEMGIIK